MTDLSIIIVNWNSVDYLRQCLLSLRRTVQGLQFEVIVLDNASADGCDTMIAKEFPETKLIMAGRNLGFARANNLAFVRSQGEILLFLNPDTEVIDDAIPGMITYLRSHSEAGAVGARLLNTDGTLQTSCVQPFPTILNQALDFGALQRRFPGWKVWGTNALFDPAARPARVDAISGACFMIKRSVFEEVHGFSDEYFMYSDDLDLSYKVRQAGYEVVYVPGCEVTHYGGKSTDRQPENFADVLQRESLELFFRRRRSRFYAATYRATTAVMAVLRITAAACLVALPARGRGAKQPRTVVKKWLRILGWSLGLETRKPAASHTAVGAVAAESARPSPATQ